MFQQQDPLQGRLTMTEQELSDQERLELQIKISTQYEGDLDKIRTILRSSGQTQDIFVRAWEIIKSINDYSSRPFRPQLFSTLDVAREITAKYLITKPKTPKELGELLVSFSQPDEDWDKAMELVKKGKEVPRQLLSPTLYLYGNQLIEIYDQYFIWRMEHQQAEPFSEIDPAYWSFMRFASTQIHYFFY
jgi:hypothetical protein